MAPSALTAMCQTCSTPQPISPEQAKKWIQIERTLDAERALRALTLEVRARECERELTGGGVAWLRVSGRLERLGAP